MRNAREGERKTAYVSALFGFKDPSGTKSNEQIAREQFYLRMFEQAGADMQRGILPDYANRRAFGKDARKTVFLSSFNRCRSLAEKAGIAMPRTYETAQTIIDAPVPLVAKRKGVHWGREKYLLGTREDRERFVAVAFSHKNELRDMTSQTDVLLRRELLTYLLRKVQNKQFSDLIFMDTMEEFVVEQYIENNADRYTSLRCVTDIRGKIHSLLLLYSDARKGESTLRHPEDFTGYDEIFFDRNSPLALQSPDFAANRKGNGWINLLTDTGITDPTHVDLLRMHAIDPNHPKLASELMSIMRKLGKLSRFDDLLVGLDIVFDKDGNMYLLEIQTGPSVDWEDTSMHNPSYTNETHTRVETKEILLRRVLTRL